MYGGKHVTIKQLKRNINTNKEVLEESKFLNALNHPNIVTFHGLCLENMAIMIGLEDFNFSQLNIHQKTNNLEGLLEIMNTIGFEECDHLVPSIGKQIIEGLPLRTCS